MKRIFQKPAGFLKDSHFGKDDILVDVDTAYRSFVEGKAAMFHGYPALMQRLQTQMDAELICIPYFPRPQRKPLCI